MTESNSHSNPHSNAQSSAGSSADISAESANQIPDKHVPGEVGVWVFIFGDLMVFTLFFVVFLYYRSADVELYQQGRDLLNLNYGVVNTLVLLLSSWFLVTAVTALREQRVQRCKIALLSTIFCGLCFVAIKYLEYSEKISSGYSPNTSEFFMFYFVFTGIHLLHLVIGIIILVALLFYLKRRAFSPDSVLPVEGGATYWHMVDLLWVVLFPLFYLLP